MIALLFLSLFTQAPKETNPVKIVINTSITLYQNVISPSQGDVCNFSPSCSQFAKQAIEEYGPFWGPLMGADRFMRCNAWSYEHFNTYYSGITDHKINDPIENNFIFNETRIHMNRDTNDGE